MKKLAKLLCKYETGKKQVDIAQMSEILRKLAIIRIWYVRSSGSSPVGYDAWLRYVSKVGREWNALYDKGRSNKQILEILMKKRGKKK